MDRRRLQLLLEDSVSDIAAAGTGVSVAAGPITAVHCKGEILGEPVTAATLMYAASVAKQVAGYLTALAVHEGLLHSDTLIIDLLPTLPSWLRRVRIRHLLHHTSGIPEITESLPGPPTGNAAVLQSLHAATPDTATPGTRFSYNNTGYILLAEAIGAAYGTPLDQLARQRIFKPLRMVDTRLGGPALSVPNLPDPPGTIGDGGLWTTLTDLRTWLTALNHRQPNAAAALQLESPGSLDDGSRLEYGWGVRITDTTAGPLITHGGTWPGWLAKTVRYPDRDIAVAVLAHQSDERTVSQLGVRIAERLATAD